MKFKYTANIQVSAEIEIEAKSQKEADGMASEWLQGLEPGVEMKETGYELICTSPEWSEVIREGL